MKRNIKKLTALLLAVLMIAVLPASVLAAEKTELATIDPYAVKASESFMYEDVRYTLTYDYDEDGNQVAEIYNHSTGQRDVYVYYEYSEDYGEVYMNGSLIGTIETTEELVASDRNAVRSDTGWVLVEAKSKTITWTNAITVVAYAGMVAAAMGYIIGYSIVIEVMSEVDIVAIVNSATGGLLTYSLYDRTIAGASYMRYVWVFRPSSGKQYGSYESILAY